MKRYLLFDSGCTFCSTVARELQCHAADFLLARSLRDPEMQALLGEASPTWRWQPTLIEVDGSDTRILTGASLLARLVLGLGLHRTLRIARTMSRSATSIGAGLGFLSFLGSMLAVIRPSAGGEMEGEPGDPAPIGMMVTCPPGTYDMLDWMTLDPDLRNTSRLDNDDPGAGHYLGTAVWGDKFWWLKHRSGNIWDTWLYDDNNVYWYLTEEDRGVSWDDPAAARNFKKASWDRNFRVAKRCQEPFAVSSGGWNDTRYDRYTDCKYQSRHNLQGGYFTLAGPYGFSLGGDLPANMSILHLTHLYNCNTSTGECKSREVWWLSRRYGLVRWQYFERSDYGQPEVHKKTTTFNRLRAGTRGPNFPCW